jgi:hypothetical protein
MISPGARPRWQNLTAGVRAKTWSEDSEGYASEAVELRFSTGKGYCSANDGRDRLTVVRPVNSKPDGCVPKH